MMRKNLAIIIILIVAVVVIVISMPALFDRFGAPTIFAVMSVFFMTLGVYHFRTARDRAAKNAALMVGASPLRRLWLPPRFYSSNAAFWQFRVAGVLFILYSLVWALAAFLAHGHR